MSFFDRNKKGELYSVVRKSQVQALAQKRLVSYDHQRTAKEATLDASTATAKANKSGKAIDHSAASTMHDIAAMAHTKAGVKCHDGEDYAGAAYHNESAKKHHAQAKVHNGKA